jgi:transposase
MDFVSRKARSEEEIKAIIKDYESELSAYEISEKYKISESALYRLVNVHRGVDIYPERKKHESENRKLKRQLLEREREIALLKAALKKS